jgi:hypothetical protein
VAISFLEKNSLNLKKFEIATASLTGNLAMTAGENCIIKGLPCPPAAARNDKSVGFPSGSLATIEGWAPREEEGKITFQSAIISQVADL